MKVAIVGSGPVGIISAYFLLEKNHKVTLFEAGGQSLQTSLLNLDNYEFRTTSAVPEESHSLGGGSNLWMGRIGEFRDTDFLEIKNVRGSDWPFCKADLKPHYDKVASMLTSHTHDDSSLDGFIAKSMGSNLPDSLRIRSFRFINLNSFNVMLDEMRKNMDFDLRLNSYCKQLREVEESKVVVSVTSTDMSYQDIFDAVIVCGGALQSTALMLRSKSLLNFPSAHLVGNGLMEHLDGYVGRLIAKGNTRSFWSHIGSLDQSRQSRILSIPGGFGLAVSDELSIQEQLINAHLEVVPFQNRYYFENLVHPTSHFQANIALRVLASSGYLVERVYKKTVSTLQVAFNKLLGRDIYSLWLKGEEIRFSDSQVTLDRNNPDLVIYDHRLGDQTFTSIRKVLLLLKREFSENKLGKIKLYKFIVNPKKTFYLRPNWHPMGTLRMSKDPETGVVRENFRFGDTHSIYIADSSIFPTGSNANPTFTALALASKLVEDNF